MEATSPVSFDFEAWHRDQLPASPHIHKETVRGISINGIHICALIFSSLNHVVLVISGS